MSRVKRINRILMLSLAVLFCLLFTSGCLFDTVTPVAMVKLKSDDGQVVVYTSHASSAYPHIFLFESESDIPNSENYSQPADYRRACESSCVLYISFTENMGKYDADGEDVMICKLGKWNDMSVTLHKDNGVYSASKSFYINNVKLTESYKSEGNSYVILRFDDVVLNRSNTNGVLKNIINLVEYK